MSATRKAWTPDKMFTRSRVTFVAKELFPDDYHVGDCRDEAGRPGEPCNICARANELWATRVEDTRRAMFKAFGHDPDNYPWEEQP